VPTVGHPEVLGHRDLHRFDVVPVPDRLQHGVREPEVEQLLEPHLAEEVIDPVKLRLVDVLVDPVGELPRRGEVVAERLLHHDPPAPDQPGVAQAPGDGAEQERRDLQVEHRGRGVPDRLTHPPVRGGVREVAVQVRHPLGEPLEHAVIDLLAGPLDGRPGVLDQVLPAPVVHGHAHDRAREQAAHRQPVERPEGHHPRQVPGDAEDDQDVRGTRRRVPGGTSHGALLRLPCAGGASLVRRGSALPHPRWMNGPAALSPFIPGE
jgi:hypothetical protein